MNFAGRVLGLIVSPDKTMAEIAREPRWEEALLIVGIYAGILVISTYQSFSHVSVVYSEGNTGAPLTAMIVNMVFTLLLPMILWIVTSAVLFLIARAVGGKGGFAGTLAGIGYSGLVKIFGVIIGIGLMVQAPVVTVERSQSGLSVSTPMMMAYTGDPFVAAAQIVGLLCLLWSCYLGILALKHCQKLSVLRAAIIVGLPLIVFVIFYYRPLYMQFI